MSSDFICAAAEFKSKPDFESGIQYIKTTNPDVFLELLEKNNLTSEFEDSQTTVENFLISCLRFVEENWDDHCVQLSASWIVVFGGDYWGDLIEGVSELEILQATGVFKAMGGML